MGKPSAPKPPDYAAAAAAQGTANIDAALTGASLASPNQVTPFGTVQWSNPDYDKAMADWMAAGGAAGGAPGGGDSAFSFDPTGDGGGYSALLGNALRAANPGGDNGKPNIADYSRPGQFTMTTGFSPELQKLFDRAQQPLDLSGLPQIGGEGGRQRIEDAAYNRLTRFMDERYGREHETSQARLRDQGIFPGMEQYTYANREFDRTKNDAYADAADRAVLAGGTEADREMQMRRQMLSEMLGERALPFQEMASLRGLLPGAGGFGGGVQPAPIMDATTAQANAANQAYGVEAGQYGSMMQTGSQLGSAALMMFLMSDRRLKSQIVRVGTHRLGIGLYAYNIFGRRQLGVMADEVEKVLPEAVLVGPEGYKMVNYGMLEA